MMFSFQTIVLFILFISFMVFVAFFGRLPALRYVLAHRTRETC